MLALPILAAAMLSQGFGSPPDFALGQKLKLHILEPVMVPTPPLGLPGPAMHSVAIVGTVVAYEPYERITLLRRGNEHSVDWVDIRWIEVPRRRNGLNVLNGALDGFGIALGVGLMAGIFDSLFCIDKPGCDHNAWYYTKRGAIIAVPIGMIAGFFSERWKRVY